jgi:hypothetical protein
MTTKRPGLALVLAVAISSIALTSVASARSDAEPKAAEAPVAFTGKLDCGPGVAGKGFVLPVLEMFDPRLLGEVNHFFAAKEIERPDGYAATDLPAVGTGTWRITNDDGAWQGSFHTVYLDDEWVSTVYPLYGSGAYEGLVALHEHRHVTDPDDYCLRFGA